MATLKATISSHLLHTDFIYTILLNCTGNTGILPRLHRVLKPSPCSPFTAWSWGSKRNQTGCIRVYLYQGITYLKRVSRLLASFPQRTIAIRHLDTKTISHSKLNARRPSPWIKHIPIPEFIIFPCNCSITYPRSPVSCKSLSLTHLQGIDTYPYVPIVASTNANSQSGNRKSIGM